MAVGNWNESIIKEFRENGGIVGGQFEGAPLLLLHTRGAKTGQERTNPVMYMEDGDRLLVFASKGGAPTNPDWYHNLRANPRGRVEVGTDEYEVEAEILEGEERDRLFDEQSRRYPGFRDYQNKTARVIPVVALRRAA